MFCPICGKALSDNARFCTACGTQMKNADTNVEIEAEESFAYGEESSVQPNEQEKEKLTFGIGPIIFCGILVLVLAVGCGILGGLYASERDSNAQKGERYAHTVFIDGEEATW